MSQSTLSDPKVRLQSDLIESSEGFLTLGHTVFVISVGELIASSWNEFTCRYQSLISASVKFLPMELPFSLSHQNTIHSTKKKNKKLGTRHPNSQFFQVPSRTPLGLYSFEPLAASCASWLQMMGGSRKCQDWMATLLTRRMISGDLWTKDTPASFGPKFDCSILFWKIKKLEMMPFDGNFMIAQTPFRRVLLDTGDISSYQKRQIHSMCDLCVSIYWSIQFLPI